MLNENKKISVLDCTLRDGGYVNNWFFGEKNIEIILAKLVESKIEIVECGFLTKKDKYSADYSKYDSIEDVNRRLPSDSSSQFAVMVNYGEYPAEELPSYSGSGVSIVRVAFHKKDLNDALVFCEKVKEKGYKVFVQAMVSISYSDSEFLYLIRKCNQFLPFSLYIVDSFGVMKKKEVMHYFELLEENLDETINVGFHAHNNMQLAFSNAINLIDNSRRNLIIDSSIHGMGRGAGNLNSEIFIEYLNDNIGKNYQLKPILEAIDKVIENIYLKTPWGYSLPNYLSAKHNCHPNYASFLSSKNNLTIDDMDAIFDMLSEEKKVSYDIDYINDLYFAYLSSKKIEKDKIEEIKKIFNGKNVVMVCPGMSSKTKHDELKQFIDKNTLIVSINFEYELEKTDYIFVGNIKRMNEIDQKKYSKIISTSNVPNNDVFAKVSYQQLLNDTNYVKDNSGLMFIKLMLLCDINSLIIIGMDYYNYDQNNNYLNDELKFITTREYIDNMNLGIKKVLKDFSNKIAILHIK